MSELIHVALDDGVMQGDSPPKLNTSSMRKRKRGTISAIIDGWASIENRIKDLNNTLGGPSKGLPINYDQFTLHYTTIYNMCTWKWPHDDSQQLHEIRKTAFENYILLLNDIQILPDSRERHEEHFLIELVYRWNIYKLMVRCLSNHVDGCENSLSTLYDVGIQCFRNLVYSRIHAEARELILDLINNEREGRQINRPLLKNVVGFYVEIGMGDMLRYETDFEPFLLAETSTYYREKALRWTGQDTCPEYMLKSENCIKEERERVSHYLHPSSEEKLVEKVQHVLLFKYGYKLLEREHSGCHSLLKEGKVDDLSRMYRLYSRVPKGLEPIGRFFKQYILDEGTALAQQAEDAALKKAENAVGGSHEHIYVSKVIQLHDKCMVYVIDCFGSHTIFHKALWEAFVFFLNKDVVGCSGAELLASFCDNILKKGGSGKLSDEAIEDSLEQVAKLLSYVNSKDMFAELYRKKLSRRLLLDKIANDDHERSALIKFKQQCGVHFSLKMEGMVTDLILGRENQRHFEEYLVQNPKAKPGLDMSVTVLTPGFWPSYKCSDIKLPSEMVRCVESFMQFYQTKTKNRKLNWVYSLGSCNINCKFGQKTIELVVGTYQAAVLLLFNNVDCLSYSEIATHIKLADDDLVRVLQSLSCAKYRILTKEPNTKTVSHTDHFSFNSDFTDKKRRIRIPLPPMDEWKKNVEDVNKARQRSADIVRIMRNRKVLGYQQLINECIVQIIRCMSKPDIKAIKERIEDFIARGYIERDKDNPRMLKYVSN